MQTFMHFLKIHYIIMSVAVLGTVFPVSAKTFQSEKQNFKVEVLTNKLEAPWGMSFLPDQSILITEKEGRLRLFQNRQLSKPIIGLPDITPVGQGGLLDVALDPDYPTNRWIYFSYTESGQRGVGLAVARGQLEGLQLKNVQVIFRQNIKTNRGRHFGSRLVFANDGTLFISQGDRGDRPRAQNFHDHAGTIARINPDGSIPADNPFKDGKKALPEIWSNGHRNAQGAALNPRTGEYWTVEHGARGGDEINIPEAGKNYGWPIISYGVHYSGGKIGVGTHAKGLEQPIYYWDPSIAPSGMAFYEADLFKNWKGNLFIGSLKFQMLVRLELEGNQVVHEERIFEGDYGRIRDVRSGPDGALYILSNDGEGSLLRLTPE